MTRGRREMPTTARFWMKVDKDGPVLVPELSECWEWKGRRSGMAYGRFQPDGRYGRTIGAHIFAFEEAVGNVPPGMELDHLCRNHSCVRPSHLEAVTHKENINRGESPAALNRLKTHCVHGHEFTPENTIIRASGRGRGCRACWQAIWANRKPYHKAYNQKRVLTGAPA